jgi:predicted nucleotidyltransferase component of viral defense system
MVILPLVKKLKKKIHKTIALAQDIIVLETYEKFPSTVIHGGTAIWRCYGSNRFSEDIDVYFPLSLKNENFNLFLNNLEKKGLKIEKFKKTNNSIFCKFLYSETTVRFEVVFKDVKNYITKKFEMSDGTFILVKTLRAEDLIKEKVLTYLKRKKIRDLYDIFFLLNFVEKKEEIKKDLKKLMNDFEKPIDEKELKVLIISGSIPSLEEMINEIKKWVK